MHIYDLFEKVLADCTDKTTYFFDDEEDVTNTLGGMIICGDVKPKSEYLVCEDKHLGEKCDFIVYSNGYCHYAYIIEE